MLPWIYSISKFWPKDFLYSFFLYFHLDDTITIMIILSVGCPFQLFCKFINVIVDITIEILAMHFLIVRIPILAFAYIFPTDVNVNEILDKHNHAENGKVYNSKQYNSLLCRNWNCCVFSFLQRKINGKTKDVQWKAINALTRTE